MPVGVVAAARAIAAPRTATSASASSSVSTLARAAAPNSPTEWPAATSYAVRRRRVDGRQRAAVGAQGAVGEQRGGDQERLGDGGVPDGVRVGGRPVRDQVEPDDVGPPAEQLGALPSSSSQGTSMPGDWAPWPGQATTSTRPLCRTAAGRPPSRPAPRFPGGVCPDATSAPRAGRARAPSAARRTRGGRAGPSRSPRTPCAGGTGPCWGARTASGRPPRATARCRGRPTAVSSSEPVLASSGRYAWSTSVRRAVVSPVSTRSGSRSSAATGRGACSQAGAASSPASAARAERAESSRPWHERADDHRTGAEPRQQRRRGGAQVALAAEEDHQPVAVDADQGVVGGAAGGAAQVGGAHVVQRRRRRPDHDERRPAAGPAERGDAGPQRVVGLPAHQGVDDERLEPRVPRAARLGGAGVDLGGGEGDLARVAQHGLAQVPLVAGRRELVAVLLDDVDRDPDELERLLQGDGAGELGRRGGEDLADAAGRAAGLAVPGDERADARPARPARPRSGPRPAARGTRAGRRRAGAGPPRRADRCRRGPVAACPRPAAGERSCGRA